jgi:SAM-dependent methyltransferase
MTVAIERCGFDSAADREEWQMTTLKQAIELDSDKLATFVSRVIGEVGAALNAALVVMGDRLGYYRILASTGACTPTELAELSGTAEPYVREWLNAQAAGGYVTYDPETSRYTLPLEHAVALTEEGSPAFLPGFFQIALGAVNDSGHMLDAARSGSGIGWHEHHADVHIGCERFFRPGYNANLIDGWLPALDGTVAKLRAGARVADVGCGHGASTILMAKAFPNSEFTGSDYHLESIEAARRRAAAAGIDDRIRFEVASASEFSGSGYDLVTMFDCLHDMGDPVGATRHVRDAIAPDGTWMIVEPMAGDRVEDNLNPVGRIYYSFSTLLCTPSSLSQNVGLALGAQAGPARIREVAVAGGFTRFARVAQTPLNQVFEVRP